MQEILQIENNNIVIAANGTNNYSDTLANFALDSGVDLKNINFVMYNRTDKVLIVDGKIVDYSVNTTYDNIIDNLQKINDKKYERLNPVKPLTPQEEKASKIKALTSKFDAQKNNLANAYMSAALAGNQSAMTTTQNQYKQLMSDYSKSLQSIQ